MESSTKEYEKEFALEICRKAANKKIEELNKELKTSSDKKKIQLEIKQIISELDIEIAEIERKYAKAEVLGQQKFTKYGSIDALENNKFFSEYVGEDTVSSYCKCNKIKRHELEIFMLKRSYNILGLPIPKEIWDSLFEYQRVGVKWMIRLYNKNKSGILADDMGLGKTVQAIAFISSLLFSKKIKNAVVLCPVTVMQQWKLEFRKIYPFVDVVIYEKSFNEDAVYIMSYEKFRELKFKDWDFLILDEGHKIKNKNSKITKHLKSYNIEHKILLTGTPIQNNLSELWSIMDFINPGLLGSYTSFFEEFENPINKGSYSRASSIKKEEAYKHSIMLKCIIDPYILRRMKYQIEYKLPSKIDKIIFCCLTEKQAQLYQKTLDSDFIQDIYDGKRNFFSGIDTLRKICNHPILVEDKLTASEKDIGDIKKGLKKKFVLSKKSQGIIEDSSKMQILHNLLRDWKNTKTKVLIFSQTVKMLNIIEESLKDYKFVRMDGEMPYKKRVKVLEDFEKSQDIFIFLLTSRVGGLGLNLVSASKIIIYDPDWNPSTDNQAKERVWRYGQKKNVEIYRLICKDTIEEKIYKKQIFKDMLSKKILNNPSMNSYVDEFTIDDLFSYKYKKSDPVIEHNKDHGTVENSINIDFVKETDKYDIERMKELYDKEICTGKEILEFITIRERKLKSKSL